ncbi:Closca [Camponotus japonicus]
MQDEHQQTLWLAAVYSSNISFYQFIDNKAQLVGTHPLSDGRRIIVTSYSAGTFIVVQKGTDGIVILRVGKNKNANYELQFKQEFEIPEVMHADMWLGMNQLYLGIASKTKIFVYVWLGEHFDKTDTLRFGARKLLPFQSKSFMHIAIVGSLTKIFRFSMRSNKFVEMQRLHYARDVSSFYFKEDHFEERFLVLVGNDSTILYKEMYGRFVPFQRIASATYIHSLAMGNTVVLLFAEQDAVGIYQYNGWRFLKTHTKLSNTRQIRSYNNQDILVAQNQDGEWKFLRPIWTAKKTWKSLQNEIAAWCLEIKRKLSQRTLEKIPESKNLVISNANIGQLRIQNLNDYNAEKLIRLTRQYNNTIAKLNAVNNFLAQEIENTKESKRTVLYGKKITVKCKTSCYIHHIIMDNKVKPSKYVNAKAANQTLKLDKLKVKTINDWKCPVPNFNIDDISVKESINGILMRDLQEKTLKISGDQEVSGTHIFINLHTINASIPLDIATNSTRQIVQMREARVKELYLTEDEFFLPLNGSMTVMNGSITATKVRVTGLVELKGGITGKGIEKLAPMKYISTPLILDDDYFLQDVIFSNLVKTKDIVRIRGPSLKEISENRIPLDSNVPVHLTLSSDKTQWNNVTLWHYTNWVTKNSVETIVISGAKFTNNSVVLTKDTYAKLPIPKLTIPLCATEVVTPEMRTFSMIVDDLVVKNLNVSHVIGADNLNTTIFSPVSALRSIDFSKKLFTGRVFVKNISASEIKGTNLRDLNIQMNDWMDINHLKGPINITKFVVDNLETPVYLNLSLPTRVKNVIIKADSDIGKINNINIQSFTENVLKVTDIISLEHVTFANGFTSSHIYASRSTLNLSHLDAHLNLHSKQISTTLKTDGINVPQTFGYIASDVPSTFVVQGSVKFSTEPIIQNIRGVNLKQLSEDIWMANEDTVLSGSNMNLKNITLKADVTIHNPINSLNVKMWSDVSSKLLSKTKEQHITVVSSFKNVEVPAIVAANNATLESSDINLKNMLTNSLMRNAAQTVDAVWYFEELNINNFNWDGKLNGINLNTDVVRHDAKQNIVTGKKTISSLATKDLWLLNIDFSNLVNNALTQNCQKITTIKGRKTFNNIILNNLSVKGAIMGRKIEEALLKSKNQTLFGIKKIRGELNAPSLIIDGIVNDVNLTELTNNQMKKHKTIQTIDSTFDFKNDLEVFGNVTISGLYERIDLTNISNQNEIDTVLHRTTKVVELVENITTALQNRAIYVNKFEAVDEDVLEMTSSIFTAENSIDLNSTCLCEPENISSLCNDTKLFDILTNTNSSAFITKKLVPLNNDVFAVMVSSDFIWIYSYIIAEEQFYQEAELYVPGILEASVEPIDNSIWIILRLHQQTLILRYQVWKELERYILPGSSSFVISKTPNNQHLLIRFDGIWNLEGISQPEHIFKMPLDGKIKTFALGADYYVKETTANNTTVLKARFVGN